MSQPLTGGLLGIHALTSLHPGSGTALGNVDLPIQRERHTQWPTISGSALKGILRDACREKIAQLTNLDELDRHDDRTDDKEILVRAERKGKSRERADNTLMLNEMFGPPSGGSSEFAGAISVSDARIVAFPVRSFKGVFAWVTCAGVLERLKRDAKMINAETNFPVPALQETNCIVPSGSPCLAGDRVILEEYEFTKTTGDVSLAGEWLATNLLPESEVYKPTRERLKKQLILLPDDWFTHFVRHATEINARIALDYETKTVKDGALFYQEYLPTETIFYSVVLANAARSRKSNVQSPELLKRLKDHLPSVLQIGGDETTGKGFCSAFLK